MDAHAKDQDAQSSPARGVRLELDAVDLTPLDELDRMRSDLTKVEEYRAKAAALKSEVAPAVWQRVVDDYAKRSTDLERLAKPLRERAVVECRKLQVIASRVLAACEQAEMVKAELEFRHAVGELPDAEFTKRLEGPHATLARTRDERSAVEEYKSRFVAALGGTWDSILATAAAPPAAAMPPAPPPAPVNAAEMTNIMPSGASDTAPVLSASSDADMGDGDESAPTVVVPPAALIVGPAGPNQPVHRLAALNYLGRSEDNQVRMTQQGVSRRHALITVTPKGFCIKDLGSQNGTFVNGNRITERVLVDGDAIDIGHAKLVFRSPWPAANASAATGSHRR